MGASCGSSGKASAANLTHSIIAAYAESWTCSGLTPHWATLDSLSNQHRFLGKEQTVALCRPYPLYRTICYPQRRLALDSTCENSKTKDHEKLREECREGDAGGQNQLIRADKQSKRQATARRSSYALMCPMARRRSKEWVPFQVIFLQAFSCL